MHGQILTIKVTRYKALFILNHSVHNEAQTHIFLKAALVFLLCSLWFIIHKSQDDIGRLNKENRGKAKKAKEANNIRDCR